MAENFAGRIARLGSKVDFVELARKSMNAKLGESVTPSLIYCLGGAEALHEPKVFEERLKPLLGAGAKVILKNIEKFLEDMNTRKRSNP